MKPFSLFLNKLFIISSKKCDSSFIDNETSIGSNLIIPTLLRDKKGGKSNDTSAPRTHGSKNRSKTDETSAPRTHGLKNWLKTGENRINKPDSESKFLKILIF
jgi:hypothetical protein